jgi:polysaccharide export outer membrane protein
MPLIGVVHVGEKNVGDAANLIRDLLAKGYLRNPQIRVNILQYAPRRYSVLGQVQKPGTYNLGEETVTTLLEAVAMAGGFSKSADLGSVVVRRKVDGQEKVFEVNTKNPGKGQTKDALQIIAGDTIIVGERLF